jgi:hypothetical protein
MEENKKHLPDREYQEGQIAYLNQKQLTDNPYPAGSPEFNRWNAGYLDSKLEG